MHVELVAENRLKGAMAAFREGMSVNRASNKLSIPRKILRSHIRAGKTHAS
jgi:hypothetical protein